MLQVAYRPATSCNCGQHPVGVLHHELMRRVTPSQRYRHRIVVSNSIWPSTNNSIVPRPRHWIHLRRLLVRLCLILLADLQCSECRSPLCRRISLRHAVGRFRQRESSLVTRLTHQSGVSYASEITPVTLRGYLTSFVNLVSLLVLALMLMCVQSAVIGYFLAACVLVGVQSREDEWSYKIPFAIQWASGLDIPLPPCLTFDLRSGQYLFSSSSRLRLNPHGGSSSKTN